MSFYPALNFDLYMHSTIRHGVGAIRSSSVVDVRVPQVDAGRAPPLAAVLVPLPDDEDVSHSGVIRWRIEQSLMLLGSETISGKRSRHCDKVKLIRFCLSYIT